MNHSISITVRMLAYCMIGMLVIASITHAEEQNVRPGINRYYENPNWQQWVNTFEKPGREVYDKRHVIVDAAGIRPGMVVADIGAGTGLFTRLFAKRVGPAGRIYAVDISRPFIENIIKSAHDQGFTNVEGVVNSHKGVSLPPDSIELAFLVDTYHHFEYPASMLASIHKSLKSGGRLIVIDFRRDPQHSSRWVMGHVRAGKDVVINEITRAGFRLIDDKALLRTNFYLVFSKLDS